MSTKYDIKDKVTAKPKIFLSYDLTLNGVGQQQQTNFFQGWFTQ